MLLTDDVNVGLILSHFDEFLRAGDEHGVTMMLIAKIGGTTAHIGVAQRERGVDGEENRDG